MSRAAGTGGGDGRRGRGAGNCKPPAVVELARVPSVAGILTNSTTVYSNPAPRLTSPASRLSPLASRLSPLAIRLNRCDAFHQQRAILLAALVLK